MKLWNEVPIPVFNPSTGKRASGAKAYFYVGGTSTPQPVYTSDDGTAPHTQPVVADANGVFPPIFIPYGPYGYRVTTSGGSAISPNVLTVQNPAPPDSGGGGGIVVQADQILQPGDTMWRLQSGVRAGWVRMNEQTIGNAGSGATERANADTLNLYTFLWALPESIAPVSGGRGANAAADFAANKTITVPTMQGYIAAGLDDMGGTVANRIQRSTTITTTNGSPNATVASATGLIIGMYVVSANVPAGTTITAISGTSITLSANATATASSVAARFSVFADAQGVGSVGGSAQHGLLERQLPIVTPAGTLSITVTNGQTPTQRNRTADGTNPIQDPGYWFGSFGAPENLGVSASFNGTAFGGAQPMPLVQPTRLGTHYIKL